MTLMLASVMNAAEAKVAAEAGADVVDLKNPAAGALGALPSAVVSQAVAAIKPQRLTSAALGELTSESAALAAAAAQISASGVDVIKVGIRRFDVSDSYLASLLAAAGRCGMVAVLFADEHPDLGSIGRLARAGFHGVMLDTAVKKSQAGLRECMTQRDLSAFVSTARDNRLVCGLAGSLRAGDVAPLLPLQPDFLGFRGALCVRGQRSLHLDSVACRAIRRLIPLDARGGAALLSTRSHGCPAALTA